MALTKEDLQAIKGIVDGSISGLKTDVAELKTDVAVLKEDVSGLKTSVNKLEKTVEYIQVVQLENNVIPRLTTMEECYLDATRRYIKNSDLFEKKIEHMDTLDQVVQDHSRQIKELQMQHA